METVAEVLINRPSKHLNRTFSYRIPPDFVNIGPGWRCVVPFSGRLEEGIIISSRQENVSGLSYKLLNIHSLVDSFPWFSEEMLKTALWISQYYMCTYIEALRLFFIDKKGITTSVFYKILWDICGDIENITGVIDNSIHMVSEKDAVMLWGKELFLSYVKAGFLLKQELPAAVHKEPLAKWVALSREGLKAELNRSPKQNQLLMYLEKHKEAAVSELNESGFSSGVIKSFCERGFGHFFYKKKKTFSLIENNLVDKPISLTNEQKQAVHIICEAIDKNSYDSFLLHGVTGSGKTEVYLRAAIHALSKGGSVLIEVPEIALTGQMVSYFARCFGEKVVFMHSNLSKGERYNNRQRIANGESNIIIGSRSALFMPFKNLKLIIIDEEYDSSYKQSDGPRYNGRDVAKFMAVIYQCPIILGAATPSIATYYAALEGKVKLIEMNHRIHNTPLPKIHLCDMREEYQEGNKAILSRPLLNLLHKTMEDKKKAILFLNRRGFATTLICENCGHVFKCPHCDVSLVYHKDSRQLKCHYCDSSFPVPEICPECKNKKILFLGRGTQRIESDLQTLLPEAECQRFDLDSTSRKNSASKILDDFKSGKIDILFGTQMVAKGHDISNVETVGILAADNTLNMPTYLAAEQTFNLITQCAGRAGRGEEQGQVILQTFNPDHYVIKAAQNHDYKMFYRHEIEFRKLMNYPPFVRMLKITCFNKEEIMARAHAERLYKNILVQTKDNKDQIQISQPFEEPIKKVRNLYYVSILIKGNNLLHLKTWMRGSTIFKENAIIIDVDPI